MAIAEGPLSFGVKRRWGKFGILRAKGASGAMEPTRAEAEAALREAERMNPGAWVAHSRYVAQACEAIARYCPHLNAEASYAYGLLHDIGRYSGPSSERHLLDGYRYCLGRGWEKAARICFSHAYMIQDIATSIGSFDMPPADKALMADLIAHAVYDDDDRLVQLCDALALPSGFCLLEKRFVDVAIRYGTHPHTVARWQKTLALKAYFERFIGASVYSLLPGAVENSFYTHIPDFRNPSA